MSDERLARALVEIADCLAERIVSRLRGAANTAGTYDSRNLPPRCTRRRFAEVCRSGRAEGARRDGRDWLCSRDAWHAAREPSKRSEPTRRALSDQANALLARSGLRVVRGPK